MLLYISGSSVRICLSKFTYKEKNKSSFVLFFIFWSEPVCLLLSNIYMFFFILWQNSVRELLIELSCKTFSLVLQFRSSRAVL